jgi:hypothetical protein
MTEVLLAIDQLVERRNTTEVLEHFLALFPDADIFTIVHKPTQVGGQAEMHPIYSTFLSNMVNDYAGFIQRSALIPGAIKAVKLEKKYDVVISISSGFVHKLDVGEAYHYVYFYEWNTFLPKKNKFITKLFYSYLNSWRKKNWDTFNAYSFSTLALANELSEKEEKVISPLFISKSFPFIEGDKNKKEITVLGDAFTGDVQSFLNDLSNRFEKVFIMGPLSFEGKYEGVKYVGPINDKHMLKYATRVSLVLDLTTEEIPTTALSTLACGTSLFLSESQIHREIIQEESGIFFYEGQHPSLKQIESALKIGNQIDRKSLRRRALRYNGRIFKSRTLRFLQECQWPLQS